MRVLVTGGTGFIGTRLVRALVLRGDDVVVLTRRAPRDAAPGRVRFVEWTPERAGPWLAHVSEVDAVVHLAGAGVFDARWTEARKRVLRSSRIEPARLLAEEMARTSSKPRVFVSGSAVGYYGARGDELLDEEAPPGIDFLARLTIDWEAAARPAREAGVRLAHPRIGIVLGLEGGALSAMLAPFKAFVGGPIGEGTQYVSWIHLHDAVRALLFALDQSALSGPFNVTAPEPVTMNELARTLGAALGRPSLLRAPAFALKFALGERSAALLTGQRAVPRKLLAAGFTFAFPELPAALADLLNTHPT